MASYTGRLAVVKYGTVIIPADSYQYSSTAKAIESLTTDSYPKKPGSLDSQYSPRKDPAKPDMAQMPSGTPDDDAKRVAMFGAVPHQIFGGIRRGTISLEGHYKGPLLAPRVGNLVTVQLYHMQGGFMVGRGVDFRQAILLGTGAGGYVTGTILVTESTFHTGLKGNLRWTIKGDMHGDFDVVAV